MSLLTNYDPGNWKAICDICGFQFKADELFTDYRGLKVCKDDLDVRQPQELLKVKFETAIPSWTRPDVSPSDVVFWANNSGWNIPWTNNLSVVTEWSYP